MSRLILAACVAALVLPGMAYSKGPKHCPPGLAKKTPACVPPGQAKKDKTTSYDDREVYRDDDRTEDYRILRVGDRVIFEGQEYTVVQTGGDTVLRRNDEWYRLPRYDDGSEYVRVGDVILRVNRKTKAVFQIIELADLILN